MTNSNKNQIPDYLLKLIDGCSSYIKIATNFWLFIAIFSIITVSPTKTEEAKIEMPFDLGKFDLVNFYPFTFVVLSLLILCYGSSLSQAIRGRKLIQRAVDNIKEKEEIDLNVDLQDIIDVSIYPTLNRVAPLAQILLDENQFLPESNEVSKKIKRRISNYYLVLKSVITLVMYFFPGYALILSFLRGNVYKSITWGISPIFFWVIGLLSFVILFQLLYSEIKYTINAYKIMTTKKK